MPYRIFYRTVNNKYYATSEPFEVPQTDDIPMDHYPAPVDGHLAANVLQVIIDYNRKNNFDFLGRELIIRRGSRSSSPRIHYMTVSSARAGPTTALTWAQENRHKIEDERRIKCIELTEAIPAEIFGEPSFNHGYVLNGWVGGFYRILLQMWDDSSFTDTDRRVLIKAAEDAAQAKALWDARDLSDGYVNPLHILIHTIAADINDNKILGNLPENYQVAIKYQPIRDFKLHHGKYFAAGGNSPVGYEYLVDQNKL